MHESINEVPFINLLMKLTYLCGFLMMVPIECILIYLCGWFYLNLADISELNLPKTTSISFPNGKDDLMNFEIIIRPDEGYYM